MTLMSKNSICIFIGAVISLCMSCVSHAQQCVSATTPDVTTIEYDIPEEDTGRSGVVWVALTSSTNWTTHLLTSSGRWADYNGGLYQPYADHRAKGLPKSIHIEVLTKGLPKGWKINVGYGIETAEVREALRVANKTIPESQIDEITLKMAQRDMINKDRFSTVLFIGECQTQTVTLNKEAL